MRQGSGSPGILLVLASLVAPAAAMVKHVLQTDFSPAKGNALQACVASIMELPLQDVPNFIASQDPYEALHQFAGARGLGFMKVETSADGLLPFPPSTPNRDVPCPSPRGAHKHAVVGKAAGRQLSPVCDPHPDGTMLAAPPVWAGFFVSLNPAEVINT